MLPRVGAWRRGVAWQDTIPSRSAACNPGVAWQDTIPSRDGLGSVQRCLAVDDFVRDTFERGP